MKARQIQLFDDTKVFVACPAGIKTGGPEALHQFVEAISGFVDAYVYYVNLKHPVTPSEFTKYSCKRVFHVGTNLDKSHNVLVVPETLTELLYGYNSIQKVVWWLSVDNYFDDNGTKGKSPIIEKILNRKFKLDYKKNEVLHLAQSRYAYDFLEKKGVSNKLFLTDYTNADYYCDDPGTSREDVVFYNPKKGYEFTRAIMEHTTIIKYVPLIGFNNTELKEVLKTGKVYIDFGNHPGKDRLPREAVMSGLCIITGKRGAAGNDFDVGIPAKYKFDDTYESIDDITDCIVYIFDHYGEVYHDFDEYRNRIRNEKEAFYKEARSIFRRV